MRSPRRAYCSPGEAHCRCSNLSARVRSLNVQNGQQPAPSAGPTTSVAHMSGRQGGPHDGGTARTPSGPSAADGGTADEIASVDRAIAALEAQREVLGDAVVDTALDPLRARRAELERSRTEQRRLVTVVFADLVDFTVLSRQLDAEDTREVVNAYFARWQRAIE